MEVQIISETAQKFDGVTYYLCGKYFQRKGVRLHRAVWEYHFGEIPKGYHVHHQDKNRNNNDISNLELVTAHEHMHNHMLEEERVKKSIDSIKVASQYAKIWHGSEDGKKWHSIHGKESWDKRVPISRTCAWCGKEYETKCYGNKKRDTFCCKNHKAAALRWRRKHEGKVNYPGRKS